MERKIDGSLNDSRVMKKQLDRVQRDLKFIIEQKKKDLKENNPITQAEIQAPLQTMQFRQDAMEKQVDSLRSKLMLAKGYDQNPTMKQLVELYNQKDADLQEALSEMGEITDPYKGYGMEEVRKNRVQGIQNWDELQYQKKLDGLVLPNALIFKKTKGDVNGSQAHLMQQLEYLNSNGVDVSKFNSSNMGVVRKLILLDDWESIKQGAKDALLEYGPKVLSFLAKRYLGLPNVEFGADSGGWIGDYSSDPRMPSKQTKISGGNYFQPGQLQLTNQMFDMNAVALKYLACVVCPERYTDKRPQNYPIKDAIIGSTQEILIKTDANGNAVYYFNPDCPFTTGGTLIQNNPAVADNFGGISGFWCFSPTLGSAKAVDPATGKFNVFNAADAALMCQNGPLLGIKSQVQQFKTSSTSLTYVSTTSDQNNAGAVTFGYFPYSAIGAIWNGQSALNVSTPYSSLGTTAMLQSQYYQTGNSISSYRYTHIPDAVNGLSVTNSFEGAAGLNEIYVLIVTGAPVSTTIGKVDISYNYEFIPSFNSQLLANVDYPTPGIRTTDLISNLVQAFPTILSMTLTDSYKLANGLVNNCQPNYESAYQFISDYINRNVIRD